MKNVSVYEAKARFSELVRRVREGGERFTITWHGAPVAEIGPIQQPPAQGWAARLEELEQRGALQRGSPARAPLRPLARRPGGLQRFLQERGD